MKQHLFEVRYRAQWAAFSAQLDALEKGGAAEAGDFPARYRQLCQQISVAKTRGYSPNLIEELNALVRRGHQQLYRFRSDFLYRLLQFFRTGFPTVVRRNWVFVAVASAVFYLPIVLVFLLVWWYPDLIYNVFDAHDVARFESMYDPSSDRVGRDREAETDVRMFGFYIANNIGVAFRTFATGLVFALGSLFFLGYNGVVFGAVASHLTALGSAETFYTFVIGHGAFELTAITFAGAAGIKLGYALIAPGPYRRIHALKLAAREAIHMMYGVILMLIAAAFVEAFWSSNAAISAWIKYSVGAVLWSGVAAYFFLVGEAAE